MLTCKGCNQGVSLGDDEARRFFGRGQPLPHHPGHMKDALAGILPQEVRQSVSRVIASARTRTELVTVVSYVGRLLIERAYDRNLWAHYQEYWSAYLGQPMPDREILASFQFRDPRARRNEGSVAEPMPAPA